MAKFLENPQGYRTLLNEWLVSYIFSRLGILTPQVAILHFSSDFGERPIMETHKRRMVSCGPHFGSKVPVNPTRVAVFNYLPDPQLAHVSNVADFVRAFVCDIWLSHHDSRQVVFARNRSNRLLEWRAYFIDYGMAFNGGRWELTDYLSYAVYRQKIVYSLVKPKEVCEEVIENIAGLSFDALYDHLQTAPSEWFPATDTEQLLLLLTRLDKRRTKLSDVVYRHIKELAPLSSCCRTHS